VSRRGAAVSKGSHADGSKRETVSLIAAPWVTHSAAHEKSSSGLTAGAEILIRRVALFSATAINVFDDRTVRRFIKRTAPAGDRRG
jgi:hypothetical protein